LPCGLYKFSHLKTELQKQIVVAKDGACGQEWLSHYKFCSFYLVYINHISFKYFLSKQNRSFDEREHVDKNKKGRLCAGTFSCHQPLVSRANIGAGVATVLWNPLIQTAGAKFGVQSNQFGFNITGTNNFKVVVETCTNLANPVWTPLQTVTLTNGSVYFSDPQWTNYPTRYYGLGLP
jgi:hypothetical protein